MFTWLKQLFRRKSGDSIRVSVQRDDGTWHEENVSPGDFARLNALRSQFSPTEKTAEEVSFVWCLVGNIVAEHPVGENKEIRRGTKHFTGGTKVYCFPPQWSGYEEVRVIGKRRRSRQFTTVIMHSKHIENWRLQKVYKPHIIREMVAKDGWRDTDRDKREIEEMLTWLPGAAQPNENTDSHDE